LRPLARRDYTPIVNREYHYVVDRDGRIFHDGTEIVDAPTLRFFIKAMTRTPEGRFLVMCQREHNWFDVPDTPFVVQRLRLAEASGGLTAVELRFAGDASESLDPATLETEDGHLYCRIRAGAFRARFGRLAMQQVAPFLAEEHGRPTLVIDGVHHPIRETPGALRA
jgi:hypothetical protein